jgi:dihydroneopterin aldolase
MIRVEVRDLRVFGRHGVHEDERARGQDFLFDVELEVGERGTSDRPDEAVDYVSPGRLLLRVRKPEVRPAGLEGTVGVTVTRP